VRPAAADTLVAQTTTTFIIQAVPPPPPPAAGRRNNLPRRRRPVRSSGHLSLGDAKFVEQSLAMRRMSNYLKMTTNYLSVEPESWVPPAPPWFLGLVKNVRRNLPICTSSPLTSTAESTGSRLT
jgi:hypothetical protein